MSERKRLIKRARSVSPERVAAVLAVDDGIPAGHFLVGNDDVGYELCCWHVSSGLMTTIIEDDALALACLQHLLANGVLIFKTDEEVEDHAAARRWPGSRSNP